MKELLFKEKRKTRAYTYKEYSYNNFKVMAAYDDELCKRNQLKLITIEDIEQKIQVRVNLSGEAYISLTSSTIYDISEIPNLIEELKDIQNMIYQIKKEILDM